MKKKRTKKYDATLKYQQIARFVAKHYDILNITGMDNPTTIFHKKKPVQIKMHEANIINEVRHYWTVLTGVACRDQLGREYAKTEMFVTNEIYFANELSAYLAGCQSDVIGHVNRSHVLTTFWIATPKKYEFNQAEIMSLLTKKGVFKNLITEYEYAQKQKSKVQIA